MTIPLEILPGSQVTLHLAIRLEDGTEALSTFDEDPVELQMGDGTLQPGLELALYGLKAGDRQTLARRPARAGGIARQRARFHPDHHPTAGPERPGKR